MRESFILKTSYMQQIELLDYDQRGHLLTALLMYEAGADLQEIGSQMDGVTAMAFSFIRADLDRNAEKYTQTVEARKAAGEKGGRPKANGFSEKQKKQMVFSESKQKQKNPDNDNDSDSDIEKETLPEGSVKKKRFAPPTPDDVMAYCTEKGYSNVDPERFVAFYESKGWMIGKNHMADWKAAVRNWNRSGRLGEAAKPARQEGAASKNRFSNFPQRDYDYPDLEKKLIGG